MLPQNSGLQSPLDGSSQSSDQYYLKSNTHKSESLKINQHKPKSKFVKQLELQLEHLQNTSQPPDVSFDGLDISPQGIGLIKLKYLGQTRNNKQSLNQSSFQKN